MAQLLGPVKLALEELVIERCSDFLSMGTLHFSPLASLSRLRVSPPRMGNDVRQIKVASMWYSLLVSMAAALPQFTQAACHRHQPIKGLHDDAFTYGCSSELMGCILNVSARHGLADTNSTPG